MRGQTNLLPAIARAAVIADAQTRYGDHHVVDDAVVEGALGAGYPGGGAPHAADCHGTISCRSRSTSGSTGTPTAHAKRWGSLHYNTRFNAERIRECLGIAAGAAANIVATVPPQHMYGTETSVLLPLLAGMAVPRRQTAVSR